MNIITAESWPLFQQSVRDYFKYDPMTEYRGDNNDQWDSWSSATGAYPYSALSPDRDFDWAFRSIEFDSVTDWAQERGITWAEVPSVEVPAVPEGLAFDRYHESMLPMFEAASKAADEAGYCAEYDRMARALGAPTRAEVRALVRQREGVSYEAYVPVTVRIPVRVDNWRGEEPPSGIDFREDLDWDDSRSWGRWPGIAQRVLDALSVVEAARSHMTWDGFQPEGIREV